MSTTHPTCPCSKMNCEGVDYHDRAADRLLTDFSSLSRNASTDLDVAGENADRLTRTREKLVAERPFCSPELQGRIDSCLNSVVIT